MTTTPATPLSEIDLAATAEHFARVRAEMTKVVIGQQQVIEQMLTALLGRGHCLLIGVPGLAKTVMAKSLADTLDMDFKRVQFTPDLMPSDITGTTVLDHDVQTDRKSFRFVPGPVFTNILLADEINRTPPKTQAALLEAMQERQVTFGGTRRKLPEPFFVLATQNPLEQEGTYPLPEAQLDRFMFSVIVTYTSHADENRIVASTTRPRRVTLQKILGAEQVLAMQKLVRESPTPPQIVRYASALARATRPDDPTAPDDVKKYVDCGAGPRAGQYLVLAAKSRAVIHGRPSPTLDDVRAAAIPVLRHRMFTNFSALSENVASDTLIEKLLQQVPDQSGASPVVYSIPATADEQPITLPPDADAVALVRQTRPVFERIRREVQQVIVGQQGVVELVLTSLLAGGHCLLVGVPGLAKTTLVQTLAEVLDLDFKRVQFTPDLMPSDITGTDVMDTDEATGRRQFRFMPGPVFSNILLADEINRTPPKTQAALLEAMQEYAVTAGGVTYRLKPPFFVLATQNPLEQEGTYPLPEAQLDRFMFMIELAYPTADDEPVIIDRTTGWAPRKVQKILSGRDIIRLQHVMRQVPISNHVLTYVTTLVRATRPQTKGCPAIVAKYVHCGAGPRAAQNLVLGAKARAIMNGRVNVSISDVKAVAIPVLRHRVFTNFLADAEGITPMKIVEELLKHLPEPKIADEKSLASESPELAAEVETAAAELSHPVTESHAQVPDDQPHHRAADGLMSESFVKAEGAVTLEKPAASPAPAPYPPTEGDAPPAPGNIRVRCAHCGMTADVPEAAVGRKAKCWGCNTVFTIAVEKA